MNHSIFVFCLIFLIFIIVKFNNTTYNAEIQNNNFGPIFSPKSTVFKIQNLVSRTIVNLHLINLDVPNSFEANSCIHTDICAYPCNENFKNSERYFAFLKINCLDKKALYDLYFALQIILEYQNSQCKFIESIAKRNQLRLLQYRFYLSRVSSQVQIYYLLRCCRQNLFFFFEITRYSDTVNVHHHSKLFCFN